MENRIKVARTKAGLSQKSLAAQAGISPNALSEYEKGKHVPRFETLSTIAKICQVSIQFLLGEIDDPRPISQYLTQITKETQELIKLFGELSPLNKKAVMNLLEGMIEAEHTYIKPFKPKRSVPFISNAFAAGYGEPDMGNIWGDSYDVDADAKGDFAIKISGDSMEPYLADGTIVMCETRQPADGEVGAFLLDSDFLCKQVKHKDGNTYLLSLNRARSDCDVILPRDTERRLLCFGTVITKGKVPIVFV